MPLYKRIPKTLWQRFWFKIRPQVVEATELQDHGWIRGQDPIDGVYKSSGGTLFSKSYFEANYEPVLCKCLKKIYKFFPDAKYDKCPICSGDSKEGALALAADVLRKQDRSAQKNEMFIAIDPALPDGEKSGIVIFKDGKIVKTSESGL